MVPAVSPIIVEALTDNLKPISLKHPRLHLPRMAGQLGETGSVSFMFDRVGEIVYKPDSG